MDAEIEDSSGAFLEAVGASTLAATGMLALDFWITPPEGALPPLPLLILFIPIVVALVVAAAAAVIGLPLTWLLARLRREAAWAYLAAGLVAGGAIPVAFLTIGSAGGGRPAAEWLTTAAFGAVPGSVFATLWWIRYRRHLQPERGG